MNGFVVFVSFQFSLNQYMASQCHLLIQMFKTLDSSFCNTRYTDWQPKQLVSDLFYHFFHSTQLHCEWLNTWLWLLLSLLVLMFYSFQQMLYLFILIIFCLADSLVHLGAAWVYIGQVGFKLLLRSYNPNHTFVSPFMHSQNLEKIALQHLEGKVKISCCFGA